MSGIPKGTAFPLGMQLPRCGQGGKRARDGELQPRGLRRGPMFRKVRFFGAFGWTAVTRDGSNNPVPYCLVHLIRAGSDEKIAETVSDASGNYSFELSSNAGFYYVVAFSPDGLLAGATPENLVAGQIR
jgi:hypothetical protein